MKSRLLPVLFALVIVCPTRADDDKKGSLEGRYLVTQVINNGKEVKEPDARGTFVDITKDRITTRGKDEKVIHAMTYTLNPTKDPKAIDMKIVEGKDKGKTASGIYKFDGDTIKVCYSYDEGKRPRDFSTKDGDNQMVITLEKQKKQ